MNKEKQKEKVFDLLFKNCKEYLRLNHWYFKFDFDNDNENCSATLTTCDTTHFIASISYRNNMWQKLNKKEIDSLILVTIHEMCHIFTWAWSCYIDDNEKIFLEDMWENKYVLIYNTIVWFEEGFFIILDRVIFDSFKKTKEYKEIIKLVKLIW